ncbi:MAG: RagB/SusD family nutrient uptake outer membrane protein [Niabella sp.]
MKKYCLIILIIAFILNGCQKDLDIVQDNQLSASNMWKTADDVKSAVYGAYTYLRTSLKTNVMYWGEYRNGLWGPGTFGTLHDANMSSTVSATMTSDNDYASWTNLYTTINELNLIINKTGGMSINDDVKSFALCHAYFLRAYCYFWIGRIWGDAPLALEGFESTSQDMYLSRSPQSDVFNQVQSDLESAEQYASAAGTDKSMATQAAINMLKADFGLWMYSRQNGGDSYLTMSEAAISALNLSTDKLESSYASIFNPATKKGTEIIWVISQNYGESEGGFMRQQLWNGSYLQSQYRNTTVPIIENQWWEYTDKYIEILNSDSTDQRALVNHGSGPYGTNGETVGWPNKYVGRLISGTRVLDDDIVLYRYAQAYLFDAEIKYIKKNYSGSLAALNVIANRAYGKASYYTDQSAEAVLQAIVTENLKEFASEGNTWWTLIRTNTVWDYNDNLKSQQTKQNILLWPITQSAINRNRNLTQTEGW